MSVTKSLDNLGIGGGTTYETFGVHCVKSGVCKNLAWMQKGFDGGGDDVWGCISGVQLTHSELHFPT